MNASVHGVIGVRVSEGTRVLLTRAGTQSGFDGATKLRHEELACTRFLPRYHARAPADGTENFAARGGILLACEMAWLPITSP